MPRVGYHVRAKIPVLEADFPSALSGHDLSKFPCAHVRRVCVCKRRACAWEGKLVGVCFFVLK